MQKRRTKKRYNLTDGVVRMQPYETIHFIHVPDVADIQSQARKSSTGKYASKSGDYKSYTRSTTNRKKARRVMKRQDRSRVMRAIRESYMDEMCVFRPGEWVMPLFSRRGCGYKSLYLRYLLDEAIS